MGRVVVGVDGSPASQVALRVARAEARARRYLLVAVLVWQLPGADFRRRSAAPRALVRLGEQEAERRLLRALTEALGVWDAEAVRPVVVRGRPEHELPALATGPDALIVVGAGLSGRGRLGARCAAGGAAVLLVPPGPLLREHRRLARRPAPAG